MSDFGDFTNEDAFDTEPPDPEQVARKLQVFKARFDALPNWDTLSIEAKVKAIEVARLLIDWLKREGAIR